MRAKIVENLMDTIDNYFQGTEGHRTDPEFGLLCNRIAGKEVDLVFTSGDAFEAVDDNYWLPDCCWERVRPSPPTPKDTRDGRIPPKAPTEGGG